MTLSYEKIKEYLGILINLLTKLLAGLGVIDDPDNPPYAEYINELGAIGDAAFGTQD